MRLSLLVPIILITLFLGGCWGGSGQPAAQPPATPPTNGGSDAATSTTEIDTSDWETYTNEEYGFGFRYPPNWIIFQEFLADDPYKGSMYQMVLRDDKLRGINIFVTTRDFIPSEGEGEISFVTGSTPLIFDSTIGRQLQSRGIKFYKKIEDLDDSTIFFSVHKYGYQSVGVSAVFQNFQEPFPYLTSNIFLEDLDTEQNTSIESVIRSYTTGNGANQKFYNEFIRIMQTVDF